MITYLSLSKSKHKRVFLQMQNTDKVILEVGLFSSIGYILSIGYLSNIDLRVVAF